MPKAYISLFLFTIFSAFLKLTLPYTFSGNELRDLESTDANFITEAATWTASSLVTSGVKHSLCGSVYLLGGYNTLPKDAFYIKTYSGLPAHTMIYFTINFWVLDSWNTDDKYRIEFDGVRFEAFSGLKYDTNFPNTFLCGVLGFEDLGKVEMQGKVFHSGTSLTIKVTNKMTNSPDDESFGLRDIKLLFVTANSTDANSYCGKTTITLPDHDCSCPTGKYQRNPGDCQNCNSACKTCYWQSSSECFSCNNGYYLSGTQCLPCHSFCSKCYGPNNDQCIACKATYFLFMGQTCVDSCTFPRTSSWSGGVQICDYVCPGTQYIYPDGSCQNSCTQYYKPAFSGTRKVCQYYCTSSSYYYSPDGNCYLACPAGYYQDPVYRYCQPCQDTLCAVCPTNSGTKCDKCEDVAILDTDGVCKCKNYLLYLSNWIDCQALDVQYIKSTKYGDQFKVRLLPTSTCKLDPVYVVNHLAATDEARKQFPPFSFSLSPLDPTTYLLNINFENAVLEDTGMDLALDQLTGVAMITKKFIPTGTYKELEKIQGTATTAVGGAVGASVVGGISLGATAALWSMISFQQFIGYFIYINVEYPFQVEFFLNLLQSTNLSFLPNPFASITDFFAEEYSTFRTDTGATKYQPPKKFVKYDKISFFVENGGSTLAVGLGLLALTPIVPLILRIRILKGRSLISSFYHNLKWNTIARSYLESGIPLTLAVFLQFRKISFDNFYNSFSTVLALIGFFYNVLMIHYLIKALQTPTVYQLEMNRTKAKIGTLYEGMALKHKMAKYYHLVILFRGMLLMFLIAFLEVSPIIQVIPLIFYNMGLIYYLYKAVSFKDIALNYINRVKETLILIGEIGVMCLTFKGGSEDYYQGIGWLTVSAFASAFMIELMYMIYVQLKGIKDLCKKASEYRRLMSKVISKDSKKKNIDQQNKTTEEVEF